MGTYTLIKMKRIVYFLISILAFSACKQNASQSSDSSDSVDTTVKSDKIETTVIENQTDVESNTLLVTEGYVLFMYPDTSEINEMQRKYDEETYSEIVADLTWYPGIASEVLDSFDIKNQNCDSEYIILRKSDKSEIKYERKKLDGDKILFHPDKEPLVSSAIEFDRELTLSYFGKNN